MNLMMITDKIRFFSVFRVTGLVLISNVHETTLECTYSSELNLWIDKDFFYSLAQRFFSHVKCS